MLFHLLTSRPPQIANFKTLKFPQTTVQSCRFRKKLSRQFPPKRNGIDSQAVCLGGINTRLDFFILLCLKEKKPCFPHHSFTLGEWCVRFGVFFLDVCFDCRCLCQMATNSLSLFYRWHCSSITTRFSGQSTYKTQCQDGRFPQLDT